MKRQNIIIIVTVVVALISAYFLFEHFTFVETDNAQIDAHTVMLASKVSGYIKKVNAEENQKVKKGDLLAEIDDRDYQNALAQAKSQLLSVEARKNDAEKNFKRLNDLFSKGAVSQQQLDQVSTTYNEAKANFEALTAGMNQAALNLENTRIVAPSDGFIARRAIEEGQLTSPGTPLFGFVGADERWVTANFKETELKSIRIGNKVHIEVDAIPGQSFEGQVESISSATGSTFSLLPPDNSTGNFTKVVQRVPVRVKLLQLSPTDIEILKAGLSAEVKVRIR